MDINLKTQAFNICSFPKHKYFYDSSCLQNGSNYYFNNNPSILPIVRHEEKKQIINNNLITSNDTIIIVHFNKIYKVSIIRLNDDISTILNNNDKVYLKLLSTASKDLPYSYKQLDYNEVINYQHPTYLSIDCSGVNISIAPIPLIISNYKNNDINKQYGPSILQHKNLSTNIVIYPVI